METADFDIDALLAAAEPVQELPSDDFILDVTEFVDFDEAAAAQRINDRMAEAQANGDFVALRTMAQYIANIPCLHDHMQEMLGLSKLGEHDENDGHDHPPNHNHAPQVTGNKNAQVQQEVMSPNPVDREGFWRAINAIIAKLFMKGR